MLYGGPLGTYLSGLSSSSSSAQSSSASHSQIMNSSTFGITKPVGSNYSGLGLRRTNSRYRNTSSVTSGLTHSSSTVLSNPLSSYYTPPVRRKYGTPEVILIKF